MAKKIALGKGMASLLQSSVEDVVRTNTLDQLEISNRNTNQTGSNKSGPIGPEMVSLDQIIANPGQPRKTFKEKELFELAQSIKENGVLQPILVEEVDGKFVLIAGERRLRASKIAKLEMIPVIIKRGTEKDKKIMALIENVQRSDLNCVEIALGYFELMDSYQLTQEEMAKKLGKERSTIANYLRILKLPKKVLELVQKELLSFGHAKILASVDDREKSIRIANEAVSKNLSVRELEKLIKKEKKPKKEKEEKYQLNMDNFKEKLERETGFHFNIKNKKNGKGQIEIKFTNEAEFNDIFEYLLKR